MRYDVICSKEIKTADRYRQGGVGMIISKIPKVWSTELTRFNGLNVVRYKVITGKQTLIIGAYHPPLHPRKPNRLGRGTDTLPGPGYYSVRGTQSRHPRIETLKSAGL